MLVPNNTHYKYWSTVKIIDQKIFLYVCMSDVCDSQGTLVQIVTRNKVNYNSVL